MTVATSKKIPPAWGAIIYLAIIHALALFVLIPSNFNWSALGVAFILYVLTAGIGITLGFHRLVAHRSYQVPKFIEYLLIFCGTLAGQGVLWIGLGYIVFIINILIPNLILTIPSKVFIGVILVGCCVKTLQMQKLLAIPKIYQAIAFTYSVNMA